MTNIDLLLDKMDAAGLTVRALAENSGIKPYTLYRRIAQRGEAFTVGEAERISRTLGLNAQELTAIFFSEFVA